MDLHIEFKLASKYQAGQLFRRFYLPVDVPELDEEDERDEKESVDSGYSSTGNHVPGEDGSDTSSEPPSPSVTDSPSSTTVLLPDTEKPVFTGISHRGRPPKLARNHISELAEQFAGVIPERECSMASLQVSVGCVFVIH